MPSSELPYDPSKAMMALFTNPVQRLGVAQRSEILGARLGEVSTVAADLGALASQHAHTIAQTHGDLARKHMEEWNRIWAGRQPGAEDFGEYLADAAQRGVLFLDIMREVGNTFVGQQANGAKPVLTYDYEMVVDGRELPTPVGYALVRILPPDGTAVDNDARPYILIDPRAGHGPGIGGFKMESQVGVALAYGHPVYFVIFFPKPEPGQTLADVCAAEGVFERAVAKRHPRSPKPVVIGNCQGGWATMLLAATNPDVTGPVVVNGAPLSYWAGVRGRNPLRYLGGLAGGALPAILLADLGNGVFDGAHLVENFETMNPGNTKFMKYYNVFAKADTERERFVGFERWWSGFYFMNEAEIRWIVENLFVGNKLEQGAARLDGHGTIDLRKIKAPIIVFASQGDDITPPPQALGWITKLYADEREIAVRGQRIIYMVHEDIGHLGIFVSAKVAMKEHDRIVSTLEAVEALAPGLYEMKITGKEGAGIHTKFSVGFEERTMAELKALVAEDDDQAFALVARLSDFMVDAYEFTARPLVRAMATPASADLLTKMHPLRMRRFVTSDLNPAMKIVEAVAPAVVQARRPAAPDNPFVATERLFAAMVEQGLNFARDVKAMTDELTFFGLYANPFLAYLTEGRMARGTVGESLRELPHVHAALMNIDRGGYAEAVIRMLILMAKARGSVRQNRLERSNHILNSAAPFSAMGPEARDALIHEQSLIVEFEHDRAVTTLPELLAAPEERSRAIALVEEIAGVRAEMNPPTLAMLMRLCDILGVPSNPDARVAA